MRVLFLHNNFPSQFRHLASTLAADPTNQVVFATNTPEGSLPGVEKVVYQPHRNPTPDVHFYAKRFESAVLIGQAVYLACKRLKNSGFVPDVVIAHSGFGQAMFIRDVFPDTKLIGHFEWYYRGEGTDADFLADENVIEDEPLRIRARNAPILMDLEACDWGITPTVWQRDQFPAIFHRKLSVLHEGIDTDFARPAPDARLVLPGLDLSGVDDVVTYVSRGLEPYRGFPQFMEAAGIILGRRPDTHVVVVGADRVVYGRELPDGRTYKEKMLADLDLDLGRIHFTGLLPAEDYLRVIQASAAHVYLSVPFVLSWSMLEAMAVETLVIGSDTAPVREVITDRQNGLLVDFFSPAAIAERVDEVLDHPTRFAGIRTRGRETAVQRYALGDHLNAQIALLNELVDGKLPDQGLNRADGIAEVT